MKASLIIPVYNSEKFLADCLESVVRQEGLSKEEYEILVINDGSTDGSKEIIDDFARRYPHLRALHQQNCGAACARTRGLQEARGEYLFILSHDCVAVPDWLSTVVNVFESNPKVGVVQGQILPEEEITRPIVHCTVVKQFSFSFETAGIAYRASALDKAGRYLDEELSEYGDDTDVAWRILEAGYEAYWINKPLVYHKVLPEDFWRGVRRSWGTQKFALLVKRHPQIRQYLRLGFVWGGLGRPVRVMGLLTTLLLLALQAWGLAFVVGSGTALYWVYAAFKSSRDLQISWTQKLFLVLPRQFLSELVRTVAFGWGTLRYRALLV